MSKLNYFFTFLVPLLTGLDLDLGYCKTRQYTFRVSYVSGSPDGVWTNSILGINGKFPGSVIEADMGDTLEITVINEIQDGQNVTIHWHGIYQRGTPFEDGPSEITQCPIKSGKTQVYTFKVDQTGTYWYHSHVNSQYTEGLWGVLIVRKPQKQEVYQSFYDDEIVITLNDWYHTSALENEEFLLSHASGGAPPYPFSALMNGVGRYPCIYAQMQNRPCLPRKQTRPVFKVQPGRTYRLRLLNTSGWTAFNFTVDGYQLRTIEVDGVDTQISEPHQAVHIAAGQRYSFLLTIPQSVEIGQRVLIRANMRTDNLFTRPNNINKYPQALMKEVTGVLQFTSLSSPSSVETTTEQFDFMKTYSVSPSYSDWGKLKFLDEMDLLPHDKVRAPKKFNKNVELDIEFMEDSQGLRRGVFNHHPFHAPTGLPELAMMVHDKPIPDYLSPVSVSYGQIVQVVINNPELGPHPVHLHGHHYWVIGKGNKGDGKYDPKKHQLNYDGHRRDTVVVDEKSWVVIRFRADNVGVWTLHCHVDWHMLTGMLMTFVEAPELAHTISVPSEAKRVCADHNIII